MEMRQRATSAGIRAVSYLAALAARTRPGERLPTAAALALAAGVSHVTMLKALARFRELGVFDVRHRTGIHRGPNSPPPLPSPPHPVACKWRRVRDEILAQVESGGFPRGEPLPSLKQLSASAGADPRTVRKALASLAADGVVRPRPRGYEPIQPAVRRFGAAITLIVRAEASGAIHSWAPRNAEQFAALERACALAGVRLEIHRYAFVGGHLVGPHGTRDPALSRKEIEHTLGFMVWTQGLDDLDLPAFIARLAAHDLPVSILDNSGNMSAGITGRAAQLCRIVQTGLDSNCGFQTGRYLRGLGHRCAVYLDSVGIGPRLEGLRRAFSHGAGGATLHVESVAPPAMDGSTEPQTSELLRTALSAFDRRIPAHRRFCATLESMREEISWQLGRTVFSGSMDSLLERALSHRGVTAWICANDELALAALRFLRGHGIAVPGRISLTGFDDTEDAFLNGLTSWNFNATGAVNALVSHILRWSAALRRRTWCEPQTVPGYLNIRQSAGPAPQ